MKSYYQHLKSTQEFGENQNVLKKPVLRSSAIFPVIQNEYYSTTIHFLGYWLLKRNIKEITLLITLRDSTGKLLLRKTQLIDNAKAFSIILNDLLEESIHENSKDFLGSVETEFNSTRDMVFPYPALVLEYHNDEFNSCVHTLGRVFNDFEDLKENNETLVPETGFDIHETEDLNSFISFVNGPLENQNGIIHYTITNSKSKKVSGDFQIGKIKPFETKLLLISEYIPNLNEFLENESGSISIKHNFEGFYPRLLVGNIQKSFSSVSFTHSYYDCTSCSSETDYWSRINQNHYDSSIYVPIFNKNNQYTNLIIYPNLSPSNFLLKISIYDKTRQKILENERLEINSNEKKLHKVDLTKLISDMDNYEENEYYAAHIITDFKNNKIPSRIKFGLNVGINGSASKLPCNICFNMRMGNPLLESKPGSFHWAPLFKNRNSILTLGNFSTLKNYQQSADLELNFYRIEDSKSLTAKLQIDANSEKRITLDDFDLSEFLTTEGWVTVKADSPYIHGYYFNLNSSGSVSGDHLF
tara:strand:+ start:222 stop:1805 length:1584 start_codon:yes stop_codon:yes gene_type:complete